MSQIREKFLLHHPRRTLGGFGGRQAFSSTVTHARVRLSPFSGLERTSLEPFKDDSDPLCGLEPHDSSWRQFQ